MLMLQDKRIFIVEDNPSNRAIEQVLLERNGAKTMFDRWGTETVERLEEFAPVDLIIMDLMLPDGVSGFDVSAQIRAMPQFANVPIVVISAVDPAEAVPVARAKGLAGFISKPIDFTQFPNQVARLIEGENIWE